tara:strand:- start:42 stop:269 length:228 start_codon:yes stop_codon:yes gene_type:complete
MKKKKDTLSKRTDSIKAVINSKNFTNTDKKTLYKDYIRYFKKTYINMFVRNERDQEIKDRALRIHRIKKSKINPS